MSERFRPRSLALIQAMSIVVAFKRGMICCSVASSATFAPPHASLAKNREWISGSRQ